MSKKSLVRAAKFDTFLEKWPDLLGAISIKNVVTSDFCQRLTVMDALTLTMFCTQKEFFFKLNEAYLAWPCSANKPLF